MEFLVFLLYVEKKSLCTEFGRRSWENIHVVSFMQMMGGFEFLK